MKTEEAQSKDNFYIIVFSFVIFFTVSFVLLIVANKRGRFPELQSGIYVGSIKGIESLKQETPIIVESKEGTLKFVLLDNTSPVFNLSPKKNFGSSSCCEPISISTDKFYLTFTGYEERETYRGTVLDKSKSTGSWLLNKYSLDNKPDTLLSGWIKYYAKKEQLRKQELYLFDKLENQKVSISQLHTLINAGTKLRSVSDTKFDDEQKLLDETKKSYTKQQTVVEKLRKQVALAQQITPMGKIVALARGTLEHDAVWFAERLNYVPTKSNLKDPALIKAAGLLKLKKEQEFLEKKLLEKTQAEIVQQQENSGQVDG